MISKISKSLIIAVLLTANVNYLYCMDNNIINKNDIINNDMNTKQLYDEFHKILSEINNEQSKIKNINERVNNKNFDKETINKSIKCIEEYVNKVESISKMIYSNDTNNKIFNVNGNKMTECDAMQYIIERINLHLFNLSNNCNLILNVQKFCALLSDNKQNILNNYDSKLLQTIINISEITSVKTYLNQNVSGKQKEEFKEINDIISKVKKNIIHTSLKNVLNMKITFAEILKNLQNNNNINNQEILIKNAKTFYDSLFGSHISRNTGVSKRNLETILQKSKEGALEQISKILAMKKVQDYFTDWASDEQSQPIKEEFQDGINGTVKNDDDSKKQYQEQLYFHLYKTIGIHDINDIVNYLLEMNKKFISDSVQDSLITSIIEILTNKALPKFEKDFNNILDNHNLRNVYKIKFQEESAPDTISNIKKDIGNDIINGKPVSTSAGKFYNFVFGHDFNNFELVMSKGTLEELKLILKTLQIQQVQEYISKKAINNELITEEQINCEYNKCIQILNTINNMSKEIFEEQLSMGSIINMDDIVNETKKNITTVLNTMNVKKDILEKVKKCFENRQKFIQQSVKCNNIFI